MHVFEPLTEFIGCRVLLAGGHPVNREVITRQLAKLGIACDSAEDGEQAWESLLAPGADYAALLTECHMPHLDGYELTKRIRNREALLATPRLPIVALTANALRGEREHCLKMGMDECLSKPLHVRELKDMLLKVVRQAEERKPQGLTVPYEELMELCSGDLGIVSRLLETFIEATRTDMEAMKHAADNHDLNAMRLLAHRISSACRELGEEGAVEALQEIEQHEGDECSQTGLLTDLYESARDELIPVLERASSHLRAYDAASSS